ncbi:MAG: transglutaminase domain-containing protein [Lachnospiraceae bacterium]|nr:transglutaminase domain-containing protein [Lachnospiraceae bacterium]
MTIYLPSFILSVILTVSTISVYGTFLPLQMLVLIILFCAAAYIALIFTDRHRLAGTLVVIVCIFMVFAAIRLLSRAGMQTSDIYFWQWVLTSGDEAESNLFFIMALILGSSMFFSITVYYFDVVLYRISFLTLVSLMPCILYAKVMSDIDNFYLILIAGGNILLHICRHRWKNDMDSRNEIPVSSADLRRFRVPVSVFFFIFSVLLICALIPKKAEAKYYDRFEDIFLGGDTSSEVSGDYSDLSDFSGNADNYDGNGNRRLYSLFGDTYTYTKSQNFDLYDFDNNRWYYEKEAAEADIPSDEWKKEHSLLSLTVLQKAIRTASYLDPDLIRKYRLQRIVDAPDVDDGIRSLFVRSENFGAVYYLAAPRSTGVVPSGTDSGYGVTRSGMFLLKNGRHPESFTYRLEFYDQSTGLPAWISCGGADLEDKEAAAMLNELASDLGYADTRYKDTVLAFLDEQLAAIDYRNMTAENTAMIPDRIRILSEEITAGLDTDHEKAAAITEYFRNGSFRYDLSYVAPDKSPEYFLFESRRGSCSQFATAFTLLARAAGLTVRYTEGYLPEQTTRSGYYTISERDSHAYPEVYLSNTGWVTFEPTIGGNAAALFDSGSTLKDLLSQFYIDFGLAALISVFIAFIIFVVVLVRLLIPLLAEGIFRLRLRFSKPEKAVLMAYKRLQKKSIKKKLIPNAYALTPRELCAFYNKNGTDISVITDNFELLTWSDRGINADTVEIFRAYI